MDLFPLYEPSLGLAPQIVQNVRDIITRLDEEGTTIPPVEQSVRVVMELASITYVLQNGQMWMSGNTDELSENDEVREGYLGL